MLQVMKLLDCCPRLNLEDLPGLGFIQENVRWEPDLSSPKYAIDGLEKGRMEILLKDQKLKMQMGKLKLKTIAIKQRRSAFLL